MSEKTITFHREIHGGQGDPGVVWCLKTGSGTEFEFSLPYDLESWHQVKSLLEDGVLDQQGNLHRLALERTSIGVLENLERAVEMASTQSDWTSPPKGPFYFTEDRKNAKPPISLLKAAHKQALLFAGHEILEELENLEGIPEIRRQRQRLRASQRAKESGHQ